MSCFLTLSIFLLNAQSQLIDGIIATVGKQIVLGSELEASKMQYVSAGLPLKENTSCLLFEELLYQKLLVEAAEIDSIEVSEAQIQSEIDRRLAYFVSQIGSEKALENFYGKTISQIKDEYHQEVKAQLLAQSMQGNITSSVNVTPAEIKKHFYSIPNDSLPIINAQVKIAHLTLSPQINANEKKQIQDKLEGLRQRIISGEDFGTLAVLYSEDPGSSVKKGELGFMQREMLVPEFSAVAFALKKGEVSEIVESSFGFHIIELIEKRGNQANFRHILLKPKVSTQDLIACKAKLDSIRSLIDSKTLSFDQAIEQFSDDKASKYNQGIIKHPNSGSSFFDVSELGNYDANLFFAIEKLETDQITMPITFQDADGNQGYRIVKLIERKEPHLLNLKDDYAQVQEMAKIEKQQKTIQKWVKSRIQTTYLDVDQEYQNCHFDHSWHNAN